MATVSQLVATSAGDLEALGRGCWTFGEEGVSPGFVVRRGHFLAGRF